jgi:hypothetical protein
MDARDVFPALAGFPDAIADVAAVAGDVTSLRLVSKAQNFAALPRLPLLERLWCMNLGAETARIVGSLVALRRLYVDGFRLPTLSAFSELERLEVLSIDGATRVASLDEFAPFCGLTALGVTHFPRVRSLEPLSRFDSLRALVVAGSIWTRMTVDSLTPLMRLNDLHYLHLTNLKALDESLEPLASLTELLTLELPNFYPMEEFAKLSARLKKTRCDWFAPFVSVTSSSCPKCAASGMLMLTGKGQPTLCATCDAARVLKHDEHFRNVASGAHP